MAPDLTLRSFTVPTMRTLAIRLVALENRCPGFSGYAGEQGEDATSATDGQAASDRGTTVRASEPQAF